MNKLILFCSFAQLVIGLPQRQDFQDFNRDQQGNRPGSSHNDPFANRNFFPQSFSGNSNNTSSLSTYAPSFPNRNSDNFDNVNYRTTESTSRSTTRFDNRHDTFLYEHDRTETPRGVHDQPFGVSPVYDTQRTSLNPINNQRPGVDHRPKGVNDRSYSNSAPVNQSVAFYLIGFCYLLKFF